MCIRDRMDISKTVWAAAGITPPEGASPDALNQLDLLTGKSSAAIRSELYLTGITGQALRSGDWVYIPQQGSAGITSDPIFSWALQINELGQTNSDYNVDGTLKADAPKKQLYNLRTDPYQSNNVIREYPEKAAELSKRFIEIRKR